MQSTVYVTVGCPSVRSSVPSLDRSSGIRRVCCWAPSGRRYRSTAAAARRLAATAPQHGAQQQMRTVPCWHPRNEAEHRLALFVLGQYWTTINCAKIYRKAENLRWPSCGVDTVSTGVSQTDRQTDTRPQHYCVGITSPTARANPRRS